MIYNFISTIIFKALISFHFMKRKIFLQFFPKTLVRLPPHPLGLPIFPALRIVSCTFLHSSTPKLRTGGKFLTS